MASKMGTTVQDNLTYSINPGGTILFAVAVGMLIMAFGVFILRAYVKIGMMRKITQDDLWMTAAMIQYIPYMIIVALGPSHGGTGRHTTDLSPQNIELALWTWAICEVLYPPISFCLRMSIACFLYRLAVVRLHKRIIVGVMIANLIVTVAYWIIMLVQCIPLSYFWQRHLGAKGYCIDHNVVPWSTIIHAVLAACLDWILAFLPIAMLWSVRINRRTKMAVSAVLGLGAFCGISLIARIPFVKAIEVSPDFLHATTGIATVAIIEPGIGIIAGSVVTLQPLLQRFKLGFASHHSSSSSRGRRGRGGGRGGGGGGLAASGGYNAQRSGGSSSNKYGIHSHQNLSWKERRVSASAAAKNSAKQWGYPVPLSTFLNSIRGASEEELRRAETGSRDGEGGEIELDDVMHHHDQQQQHGEGELDERGWEVRVSATPENHRVDVERGGDGDESLDSPSLSEMVARPGIAVTRDVKVTSSYGRDKGCHAV